MNRYSHILPNLNKSISGDSKEQSFRKSNIDYYENKKTYLPSVLKNPDEDNKFSKLLKHSSTQSIFFTLASTFLDKPKTEERKLVRSMTLKQSNTDSLNFLLEDDEKFGFIIVDGSGALFATLQGNERNI